MLVNRDYLFVYFCLFARGNNNKAYYSLHFSSFSLVESLNCDLQIATYK